MSGPDDGRADERFVRPFALTGGRTRPTRSDLDLTTLVMVSPEPRRPTDPLSGYRDYLPPEQQAILRLCVRPIAVVELASAMELPFTAVMVLVSDLIDRGYLVRSVALRSMADPQSIAFLGRVLEGLKRAL